MSCKPCELSVNEPALIENPSDPENCEYFPCLLDMLRAHLGDTNGEYSTDRLGQVMAAAQFNTIIDLNGCDVISTPAISVCGFTCVSPVEYPSFTMLTILKSACIINRGEARSKAISEGIKAVCGPASLATSSGAGYLRALDTGGACAAYESLKEELCFRNPLQSGGMCGQIVGVFTSKNLRGRSCQY